MRQRHVPASLSEAGGNEMIMIRQMSIAISVVNHYFADERAIAPRCDIVY